MSSKTVVMIGMVVGSLIGGYIPTLWGSGVFSLTSLLTTTIGGVVGVYITYKLVIS